MSNDLQNLLADVEADHDGSRAHLVTELLADGVDAEEIRSAHRQGRLTLLPLQRLLEEEGERTLEEIAAAHDLVAGDLAATRRALGISVEPKQPVYGEAMEQHAQRVRTALASGLPLSELVALNRVIGRAMASVAAASRDVMLSVLGELDTPGERGLAAAQAAQALVPVLKDVIADALDAHVRELVKQQASAALLTEASSSGVQSVATAFVDAVGFTRIGQDSPPQKLAHAAGVLEALAEETLVPEVQLVKTIGDAVMLASTAPEALVADVLALLAQAEQQRDSCPSLHAGAGWGPAMAKAGDWYGRSVNLASRLTDLAEPATLMIDADLFEKLPEHAGWRDGGEYSVDGFDLPVHVYMRTVRAG